MTARETAPRKEDGDVRVSNHTLNMLADMGDREALGMLTIYATWDSAIVWVSDRFVQIKVPLNRVYA